ncbi:ATP-grasp ribosomal peptide maturase [Streptomyces sudanensis]|uniref:ATP-grasp ribosomal peptide maturase n=1 Tax=Streptomyces sudanensis TaxID=436397 RepID=UPI0020CC3AC7|nr:ATP-grasp ribosomal peptide maturase [Streptomyces sudanensis]MCP9958475.1 ATP-grasp ribosomal peptide maturase [Streptomyces sudanensis]MCQ0001014.1 ATP-grasp ribosomal peptide maturase [Streptomyces sudanensis]
MGGRPVLVCTESEDATADLVIAELNRRRVPVLRFDPGRDFPVRVVLDARIEAGGWAGRLTVGDRTADLSAVRALYHRRPSPYPTGTGEQAARFAAQENRRGLGGVLGALPGCLYLSHPQAIARAEYKPAQLDAATRVGLTIPATLITNDPMEAKAFSGAQPTIYKPLHAGAYEVEDEPAGIWAAPVEAGGIDGGVSHSAHLFQAQVSKVADVRAVVVGEQVLSARITAPPGVVDWRAEYQNLTYEPITCPDGMGGALVRFLADFGLDFGAFDFAVTADGTWWFLECNPNGQWAWLEDAAGLPITHAIADLLENGASRHE